MPTAIKPDVVVSLTTWKGRINDPALPKVLFRLLEQQKTTYEYRVVLVLSEEEFGAGYRLPDTLDMMQLSPRFEVLWTYKNTRALKKLDPTMSKYPGIPVITMDDDELVTRDMVQGVMDEYRKHDGKSILGHICGECNGIMRVGGLRIFPPNSLADMPTRLFMEHFRALHDDEWNGLRAKLKGTPMLPLKGQYLVDMTYGNQRCRFSDEYNRFNVRAAIKTVMETLAKN